MVERVLFFKNKDSAYDEQHWKDMLLDEAMRLGVFQSHYTSMTLKFSACDFEDPEELEEFIKDEFGHYDEALYNSLADSKQITTLEISYRHVAE